MSFLPVLHPLLLIPLCLAMLGVAVWALVRARTTGARLSWTVRVLLVVTCALLALRPGIPGGASQSVATNVDVVIALDNTASMLAEDGEGSGEGGSGADDPETDEQAAGNRRIDAVKSDIRSLIQAYPGARFALIAFDNSAQLRLPLTTDTSALMASLDVMSPPPTDTASGSSIGVASGVLQETLQNAQGAEGRARLVFYLGDGEQTADGSPESFEGSAELVDGGGVLGYGTAEGGQMLRVNSGVDDPPSGDYIQDPSTGQPALSVIDEEALQAVAEQLGVEYQHRTGDAEAQFPEAPASTTTTADEETPGSRQELSWIIALVLAGLLLIEIGVASARIGRTLSLTRGYDAGLFGHPKGGKEAKR